MQTFNRLRQGTRQPVLLGMMFAMLAAVAYGSAHVIARQVVTQITVPLVASFFALVFGTAIMALFTSRDIPKDRHAPKRGFMIMALAGAAGAVAVTVYFFALSHAPVVIVSPVTAVNPLITLLLAHLFLRRLERVTLRLWIGASLVVAGVMIIALSNV